MVDSEIHAFVGQRFLITLRYPPVFDLAGVLGRWDRHPDLTREGGGFLLYTLLDEVVDGYFVLVERLEDLSDEIEERIFADEPDRAVEQTIFQMRRRLVQVRRRVMPMREMVGLLQGQPMLVPAPLAPYYRDVGDHVIRVLEFLDNLRDFLASALEAELSQVSNRLNLIMKKLTSWAAIILIPTLIAAVYGMNFRHMPELSWRFGYLFALGLMAASAIVLYWVFKRREWL